MDPIDLKPDELDYELAIRCIKNVNNRATQKVILREFLEKEAKK